MDLALGRVGASKSIVVLDRSVNGTLRPASCTPITVSKLSPSSVTV